MSQFVIFLSRNSYKFEKEYRDISNKIVWIYAKKIQINLKSHLPTNLASKLLTILSKNSAQILIYVTISLSRIQVKNNVVYEKLQQD